MNLVYFDLESQKLFGEVGGRDPSKLLLACAVTWSTARDDFAVYWEKDVQALIAELKSADRVIGFNTIKFDYEVLRPYAPHENFRALRSTDMLQDIYRTLNFRLSLDSIARATLGATKLANGVQSVEWFRQGELDKVAERLKEHSLVLTATPAALAALADQGYDAEFGARPLKRVIQQRVEDPLSDRVLGGEFQNGDAVLVSLNSEGEIVLERDGEKQIEEAPAAPAV